jgi:methanogenic corrinoid protein MtbC1
LLACAPGERHELGLLAFGLSLRQRGFRIVYLGADTPLQTLADVADAAQPRCLVVSAVSPARFRRVARELEDLARRHRLFLGGAAARDASALSGVIPLTGPPVAEADRVAEFCA